MVLLISVLSYFDIHISARVLGVALVTEVLILLVFDAAVFSPSNSNVQAAAINPINAFQSLPASGHGSARRPRPARPGRCLLRLLVVGRLRDGPELRRGVEEPEEDRADGHVHLGDRPRHLLHGHLVGVDLGLPSTRDSRLRRPERLRPTTTSSRRSSSETSSSDRRRELPDPDRVVRLRHGLPPARRRATCTRSDARACSRRRSDARTRGTAAPHIASITQSVIALIIDRARLRCPGEAPADSRRVLGAYLLRVRPDGRDGRRRRSWPSRRSSRLRSSTTSAHITRVTITGGRR